MFDRGAFKRTVRKLHSVQDDANRPDISTKGVAKATDSLGSNIIGSATSLPFELIEMVELTGKAKISELNVIIIVEVKVAHF